MYDRFASPADEEFDYLGGNSSGPDTGYSKACEIYSELLGYAENSPGLGNRVSNQYVERANVLIQEFAMIYNEFSTKQITLDYHKSIDEYVLYGKEFLQQLNPILNRMASKLGLTIPSKHESKEVGFSEQFPRFHFEYKPQNTLQSSITISVEQKLELIEREIIENISEEDFEKIKPVFEDFKKRKDRFSAQKLVEALLSVGGGVATSVITSLILKALKLG